MTNDSISSCCWETNILHPVHKTYFWSAVSLVWEALTTKADQQNTRILFEVAIQYGQFCEQDGILLLVFRNSSELNSYSSCRNMNAEMPDTCDFKTFENEVCPYVQYICTRNYVLTNIPEKLNSPLNVRAGSAWAVHLTTGTSPISGWVKADVTFTKTFPVTGRKLTAIDTLFPSPM